MPSKCYFTGNKKRRQIQSNELAVMSIHAENMLYLNLQVTDYDVWADKPVTFRAGANIFEKDVIETQLAKMQNP